MKKLFLSLVVAMLVIMPIMADNDKIITREELPEKAQIFLTKHFADVEILYAKAERDMGVITSYDVVLDGNVKVEFNRSGEWINVDCEHSQVPNSVLPQGVLDYVSSKFAKAYVVEIERGLMGYDVKLSNDLDLDFDKNGKFLRVD
jgi:pyridoxal/pyridoxine/pyridoxamine kinase